MKKKLSVCPLAIIGPLLDNIWRKINSIDHALFLYIVHAHGGMQSPKEEVLTVFSKSQYFISHLFVITRMAIFLHPYFLVYNIRAFPSFLHQVCHSLLHFETM